MFARLSRRNLVLGGLLALTLAVSAWTLLGPSGDTVVEPVVRAAKPSGAAQARRSAASPEKGQAAETALAARPAAPAVVTNLFGSYSYQAAPAPAARPAAATPHAPPLPFTYAGHLEIDGRDTYLFLQGDVPVSLAVGAAFGDFTLVEARDQTLVFLHGPTGERVSLPIAAVNG